MRYNLKTADLVAHLLLLSCVKAEGATKRGRCNLNGASNGLHLYKTLLRDNNFLAKQNASRGEASNVNFLKAVSSRTNTR